MQAPQSSTASGKQSLPSPFTAPLHAALRYMERQREGHLELTDEGPTAEATGYHVTDFDSYLQTQSYGPDQPGRGPYAARSVVAASASDEGLDWDKLHSDEQIASGRLSKVNAGEAAIGNTSTLDAARPSPDADAVRAAILRLAKASRWTERISGPDVELDTDIEDTRNAGFQEVALQMWDGAPAEQALAESDAQSTEPAAGDSIHLDVQPAPAAEEPSCSAESELAERPALAHDARNLLAALGLYSELLGVPGVLQERHRHYAEDLKMLVVRSQVLIERLLWPDRAKEEMQGAPQMAVHAGRTHPRSAEREQTIQVSTRTEVPVAANDQAPDSEQGTSEKFVPLVATAERRTPRRRGVRLRAGVATANSGETCGQQEIHLPQPQPVSLAGLLRQWSSLLATIAQGALTLRFGPDAELPIAIPEESLERILVNLVGNAREAIERRAVMEGGAGQRYGAIRIGVGVTERAPHLSGSAAAPERRMVLRIDDSGCGMSEESLRRVQDGSASSSSSQANDRARGGRRRGLGLRIVRELVAASDGEMFMHSQPGAGTRIEIHWPLANDVALATAQAHTSRMVSPRIQSAEQWVTDGTVRSAQDALCSQAVALGISAAGLSVSAAQLAVTAAGFNLSADRVSLLPDHDGSRASASLDESIPAFLSGKESSRMLRMPRPGGLRDTPPSDMPIFRERVRSEDGTGSNAGRQTGEIAC